MQAVSFSKHEFSPQKEEQIQSKPPLKVALPTKMTSPAKAEKNSSIFVCARDEVTHIFLPYLTEEISFSNIFLFPRWAIWGMPVWSCATHRMPCCYREWWGLERKRAGKSRIISTFATGGYGKTAVAGTDNKERKLSEIRHIKDMGFHSTLRRREIETMLNFDLGPTLPQGD